jgi:zinc-finger of transposase IS204/IS1001/IS1096/IS1165
MPINFRISALVPVGLIVESVAQLDDSILVTARAGIQAASCPLCGSPSRRVHSRYVREVSDLPCSGRSVRLRIVIRRYRCDTQHCRRRILPLRLFCYPLDFVGASQVWWGPNRRRSGPHHSLYFGLEISLIVRFRSGVPVRCRNTGRDRPAAENAAGLASRGVVFRDRLKLKKPFEVEEALALISRGFFFVPAFRVRALPARPGMTNMAER